MENKYIYTTEIFISEKIEFVLLKKYFVSHKGLLPKVLNATNV